MECFQAPHFLPSRIGLMCRTLTLRYCLLLIVLQSVLAFSLEAEEPVFRIVELPQPNSGTFSFQQAEARKSEILSNAPTSKLENWKNPYMGFCVHIEKDDSITVYNYFLDLVTETAPPLLRIQTNQGEITLKQAWPFRIHKNQSLADIKKFAELPLDGGNPGGVLITSDIQLKDSKTIHEVLKALFHPGIQIFYARGNESGSGAKSRD
jgi:hypothetical protein